MIYLLDANVLIDANRDYYPIDRVPEFWRWLEHQGANGRVKVPIEICDEIHAPEPLASWIREDVTVQALRFESEVDPTRVARVVEEGYAADLTEDEMELLGKDPLLIAYALAAPGQRCVVTTERSKPSAQRGNRKVPDVCNRFGIRSVHTFGLTKELDFRTNWSSPVLSRQ
jgi:hypothetical protein